MNEGALPKDDSDFSLPGRADENNATYFEPEIESKSKGKSLAIFGIAFILVAAGVFTYYFLNQSEIDSQILDNTTFRFFASTVSDSKQVHSF